MSRTNSDASLTRNIDTDKPQLAGENDFNKIKNKLKPNDGLKTTENTDMLVHMFANEDLLKTDTEMKTYDKKWTKEKLETLMKDTSKAPEPLHIPDPEPTKHNSEERETKHVPVPELHEQFVPTAQTGIEKQFFSTKEEESLAKLDLLRKMSELARRGVTFSQNYSIESDYSLMKYEYDLHSGILRKHETIKWLGSLTTNICWGLELGNRKWDPFGFNMNGLSNQIQQDIDGYYDIFGDLADKWFPGGGIQSPEVRLIMAIGGTISKITMINYVSNLAGNIKTMDPELHKTLKQNAINDKLNEMRKKKEDEMRAKAETADILRKEMLRKQNINQNSNTNDVKNMNHDEHNEYVNIIGKKNREIDELQRQLAAHKSDTRSSVQTKKKTESSGPTILRNNNSYPTKIKQENTDQVLLSMPVLPPTLQKNMIPKKETITINENIDDIIKTIDSQSKITKDDDSRASRDSRTRRKKLVSKTGLVLDL